MSEADLDVGSGDDDSIYVESQVIMTTVRVVAPFSFTYGMFLLFHGANSPGGSFQGGAVVGATIIMIAFAFGIEPTRDWLRNRTVVGLAAGGVAAFTLVGLAPLAVGGRFLEHPFLNEFGLETSWGLEAIEVLGVGPIVAGIVAGLFFVISAGDLPDVDPWGTADESTNPSEPTAGTGTAESIETSEETTDD